MKAKNISEKKLFDFDVDENVINNNIKEKLSSLLLKNIFLLYNMIMSILDKIKRIHKNVYAVAITGFFMQLGASIIYCTANLLVEDTILSRNGLILLRQLSESISNLIKVPSGYISDLIGDRKTFLMIGNGSAVFWKLLFFITAFRGELPAALITFIYIFCQSGDRITNSLRDVLRDALVLDSSVNKNEIENKAFVFSVRKIIASMGSIIGGIAAYIICSMFFHGEGSNIFAGAPLDSPESKRILGSFTKKLYGFTIIPVTIAVINLNKAVQNINDDKEKIVPKFPFKERINLFLAGFFGIKRIALTKEELSIREFGISARSFVLNVMLISLVIFSETSIFIKKEIFNMKTSSLGISNKQTVFLIGFILASSYFVELYKSKFDSQYKENFSYEFKMILLMIPKLLISAAVILRNLLSPVTEMKMFSIAENLYVIVITTLIIWIFFELLESSQYVKNLGFSRRTMLVVSILLSIIMFYVFYNLSFSHEKYITQLPIIDKKAITFSATTLNMLRLMIIPFAYLINFFCRFIGSTEPYKKLAVHTEKFGKLSKILAFATLFYVGKANDTIFFSAGQTVYAKMGYSLMAQKLQVPLMFTFMYVSIILSVPVYSYLMEKKYKKTSMALMVLALILSNLLLCFGTGFYVVYGAIFLLGFSQAGTDTVVSTITSECVPENTKENLRGTVFGFLHTFIGVSAILSTIIFVTLKEIFTEKIAMIMINIPSVIAFLISFFI